MTGVRRNLDDVVYEEDGYHHNSYNENQKKRCDIVISCLAGFHVSPIWGYRSHLHPCRLWYGSQTGSSHNLVWRLFTFWCCLLLLSPSSQHIIRWWTHFTLLYNVRPWSLRVCSRFPHLGIPAGAMASHGWHHLLPQPVRHPSPFHFTIEFKVWWNWPISHNATM